MYLSSVYGLANNPEAIFPYADNVLTDRTWLDHRHPEWKANVIKWIYARDVYQTDVLDPAKIGSYLVRKKLGEPLDGYSERQALADFTSHFGVCADSLAGMLFHVEDDASRPLGRGKSGRGTKTGPLGAPEDSSSVIGHLYRDADGKGTGYKTIWKQLGIELVITHCHWFLLDMVGSVARFTLIEPERVVDWDTDADGLAWVKVYEQVASRENWQTAPNATEQYIVFDRTGWQRYREAGEKDKPTVEPVGPRGKYKYVDASGKQQLPIFRVQLPLRRNVGFPLAKKNVVLFNKESERDTILRSAFTPKVWIPADDDVFDKTQKAFKAGAVVIQEDPNVSKQNRFDAPPTGTVEVATKVIEQKREDFYRTFFREYADVGSRDRVTATEVRQDASSGIGAFLQMLKSALDDAENQALWRLEQAVFPNNPENWNLARVERSANFTPLNPDEMIERLRTRYFGQATPVPVDRAALKEVLRQILEWDAIELDEKALDAALDNYMLMQTLDLSQVLSLPPAAKAQLAAKWGERLGITVDVVEAQRIATSDQQSKDLMAQPFGPPPGNTPPEPKKPNVKKIASDGAGGYTITEGR